MLKSAGEEPLGTKRLVLAFDGGCLTCSDLARRIEEKVGDKLEVRSLHDPRVEHWRKQALGEDAPWAPTLIEVEGPKVQAWTGYRMGLALSRFLGPVATWRIMHVLGEAGTAVQEIDEPPVGMLGRAMGRGQFLKGVGGMAVAMSVLSGTGTLASSARAAGQKDGPRSVGFEEIEGERLIEIVRKIAQRRDVTNVVDAEDLASIAQRGGTDARAAIHRLEDGNEMLAVGVPLDGDRVLLYYEFEEPVRIGQRRTATESEALLLRAEDGRLLLEGTSDNGGAARVPQGSGGEVGTAQEECGNCTFGAFDTYPSYECVEFDYYCIAERCVPCAPGCLNLGTCLVCLAICGFFGYISCCTRYGYICRCCSGLC